MKITAFDKTGNKLFDLDSSKEIARGGEGFLLPLPKNKNQVVKLYHPGCCNMDESKFNFLLKLTLPVFIKPETLLYDKSHSIIGFIMNYLPFDFYPLDAIFNKNFCLKNNFDFVKKEKIAKQLIEAVKFAHNNKINIGDLSGLNVMINNNGDVRFIDVDSYDVPRHKHSNKLLEEIRDYLHGGRINENSDYFALSVVIFNYLTYLHPFKGVHKKFPKLSDRMIHKIPVFLNDPELIKPKCYQPLTDKYLTDQFEKLYLKGERFILSIDKFVQQKIITPVLAQNINEKDVLMQNIFHGETIEYAFFGEKSGMLRTKKEFIIYDVSSKGYATLKSRLSRQDWDDVFIGKENIVITKDKKLWLYNKDKETTDLIVNLELIPGSRFVHLDNHLIMIDDDYMWKINLDVVKFNNILVDKTPVFTQGFNTHNGIIQNISGTHYIHFNNGNVITSIMSTKFLKGVYQVKDIGIAKYEENKQIKYQYYNLIGSKINFFQTTENFNHFAYKGENGKNAMIFVPEEGKIIVLRGQDFYQLAEIKCSIIDENSRLYNTSAGIISVNENEAWLINKR